MDKPKYNDDDDTYSYKSPEQARALLANPNAPRSLRTIFAVWIVVGTLLGFAGALIFA